MSSTCCHSQETNSQIRRQSVSSTTSDDDEDFIDDDVSNDRSIEPIDKHLTNHKKNKKTLGRVKIKMAYIDNKIRRYTTFSKRKTGIMKKAYELATLTGTEVMLLVASETGHVYTYATVKLQPMITSEAGKALIQTCLAKDESIIEQIVDTQTTTATTLNNNDVIFIDENQRKKRLNISIDNQSTNVSNGNRPIKRAKLSSLNKIKSTDTSNSQNFPTSSQTTTLTLPLPCFIQSDSQQQQQQQTNIPSSYTIDLNTLKNNGMNIIFTPSTSNTSETSLPSNSSLVLTLSNFSYQPS
ncbi:unnamed protein product [Rotaria sp. Silwood1]|nr:unnamed protein product [Rotaria sp. Silwood1]CAF3464923.1 unnamed protein product [Rotaria sp. Silwood1]CAF3468710.1 unnamed protein product [Rotaria sp. Silwood1]CAF3487443.1 unnamed protein product [Rotaria sp. Silwood1]CAF4766778.1 unnamed protein product [Rotaria sp. Silwood1]